MHLCIDMQRLFTTEGPWPTPWLDRVLPCVLAVAEHRPEATIFTRFIPPKSPEHIHGAWRDYYRRWRETTLDVLDPTALELVPPLARLTPPATVVDKPVYSGFVGSSLRATLVEREADGVIVTGAETDVCVLASVLDAVDLGYPVHVVTDAVCSSADSGHDAVLTLYRERFSSQIRAVTVEEILAEWPRA
jgi:nicotinamidase-related amidase